MAPGTERVWGAYRVVKTLYSTTFVGQFSVPAFSGTQGIVLQQFNFKLNSSKAPHSYLKAFRFGLKL